MIDIKQGKTFTGKCGSVRAFLWEAVTIPCIPLHSAIIVIAIENALLLLFKIAY